MHWASSKFKTFVLHRILSTHRMEKIFINHLIRALNLKYVKKSVIIIKRKNGLRIRIDISLKVYR